VRAVQRISAANLGDAVRSFEVPGIAGPYIERFLSGERCGEVFTRSIRGDARGFVAEPG
jgi:hypothetical protein